MSTESLLEFLGNPRNYPFPAAQVERVETHISWVFLVAQTVYKVKKPVKFDFLDFSTLALRKKACEREVRLNRRLAEGVYQDVVGLYFHEGQWSFQPPDNSTAPLLAPIDSSQTTAGDASPSENGAAPVEPAEYAVQMVRLPHDRMLDTLVADGQVTAEHLDQVASVLVPFYQTAKTGEKITRAAAPSAIEANVRANLKTLRELRPTSEYLDRIESAQLEFVGRQSHWFEDRAARGKIRDCHGDLRCEHICMTTPPVIFDCIEFNDRFRHLDILDDIAFLIMDLETRGREDLAGPFWAKLAKELGESEDELLMDFYCAYRASVRAKVEAIRQRQRGEDPAVHDPALPYLKQSAMYCGRFHRPCLIVTVGLMGTGKSTLAKALVNAIGLKRFSSDAVRKELFKGPGRTTGFRKGKYEPELSEQVYQELLRRAEAALRNGASVVLDATFIQKEHRMQALAVANATGARPLFLEFRLATNEAIARLHQRFRKDRTNSDGRPELYEEQRKSFEPIDDLPGHLVLALNSHLDVPTLVDSVLTAL